MNPDAVRKKFGGDYSADAHTFLMGIDHRFTAHFAARFKDLRVLETCTGGGFTTMAMARAAKHVFTIEIDPAHQAQAIDNIERAGLSHCVSFISGNILDPGLLQDIPPVDAAFIDPDWAVTGPDHVYRFQNSNTNPPADAVLNTIFKITDNVAMVLPPRIETQEFAILPKHERQHLFIGPSHELYCLYFGELAATIGKTEFRVPR